MKPSATNLAAAVLRGIWIANPAARPAEAGDWAELTLAESGVVKCPECNGSQYVVRDGEIEQCDPCGWEGWIVKQQAEQEDGS